MGVLFGCLVDSVVHMFTWGGLSVLLGMRRGSIGCRAGLGGVSFWLLIDWDTWFV
jgi:hypothetical protein